MNDQVKIEKLTLKVGDKTIELSLDEAKDLQKELNDTLGDNRTVYWPVTVIQQRPYWQEPGYIPSGLWPYHSILTCGQFDQPSALSGSPVQSFGTLTQPNITLKTDALSHTRSGMWNGEFMTLNNG